MIRTAGVVGALAAAAVGAVAWALVGKFTGYEVGYLAWGIGAAIGFLSNRLGSRGVSNGVLCAALALVSIAVGKVLSYQWSAKSDIAETLIEDWTSQETFLTMQADAAEFTKVKNESDYPKFMVTHAYTEASDPGQVPAEDLTAFKSATVPRFKWMVEETPDYETWRAKEETSLRGEAETAAGEAMETLTMMDYFEAARADLSPIDILFAVLGVVSAFALGKGSDEPSQKGPPIVLTGPTPTTEKPNDPPA